MKDESQIAGGIHCRGALMRPSPDFHDVLNIVFASSRAVGKAVYSMPMPILNKGTTLKAFKAVAKATAKKPEPYYRKFAKSKH